MQAENPLGHELGERWRCDELEECLEKSRGAGIAIGTSKSSDPAICSLPGTRRAKAILKHQESGASLNLDQRKRGELQPGVLLWRSESIATTSTSSPPPMSEPCCEEKTCLRDARTGCALPSLRLRIAFDAPSLRLRCALAACYCLILRPAPD